MVTIIITFPKDYMLVAHKGTGTAHGTTCTHSRVNACGGY